VIFTSSYTDAQGVHYLTSFYAKNQADAEGILKLRFMGEVLFPQPQQTPPVMTSALIAQWRFAEAIHAACWLGMVGCASGLFNGFNLLRDRGLIHSISHLVTKPPSAFLKENLTDKIRLLVALAYWNALRVESAVPGFQLCDGDVPPVDWGNAPEPMIETLEAVRLAFPREYEDWRTPE